MTGKQARITEIERRLNKLDLAMVRVGEATRIVGQGIYMIGIGEDMLNNPYIPPTALTHKTGTASSVIVLGCFDFEAFAARRVSGAVVTFSDGMGGTDVVVSSPTGVATSSLADMVSATVSGVPTGFNGTTVAVLNGQNVSAFLPLTSGYICVPRRPLPILLSALSITDSWGTIAYGSGTTCQMGGPSNVASNFGGNCVQFVGTAQFPLNYGFGNSLSPLSVRANACEVGFHTGNILPILGETCLSTPGTYTVGGNYSNILSVTTSPYSITFDMSGPGRGDVIYQGIGSPTCTVHE